MKVLAALKEEWKFLVLMFWIVVIANDTRQMNAEFQVRNISHFKNNFCEAGHMADWLAMQDAMFKYKVYTLWTPHPLEGRTKEELCPSE